MKVSDDLRTPPIRIKAGPQTISVSFLSTFSGPVEDFVMPFRENHRAVVIGERTQGSSGNPYRADLGDGMRVAIGAVRYRFPDGRRFEGIGIDPDVLVDLRIADLQSGRDTVLERARELATAK